MKWSGTIKPNPPKGNKKEAKSYLATNAKKAINSSWLYLRIKAIYLYLSFWILYKHNTFKRDNSDRVDSTEANNPGGRFPKYIVQWLKLGEENSNFFSATKKQKGWLT